MGEEVEELLGVLLGGFDVGEVSGGEFGVSGAGDFVMEVESFGGWGDEVVGSGEDESGGGDASDFGALVHVADGGAAGGVADGGAVEEHFADGSDEGGLGECGGREPALEDAFDDGGDAALLHGLDAGVPDFWGADAGGCVGEGEFVKAVGSVDGETHADHAAHRESAEVDAVQVEVVEEGQGVAAELGDGVGAGGCSGLAVAAGIVANDVEVRQEGGHLRIPHGGGDAERVGEEERG